MPPAIDLEPFRDEIISLAEKGTSYQSICNSLQSIHNLKVDRTILSTRLKTWGFISKTFAEDTILHDRLRTLIFQLSLLDKQILPILQSEGYKISGRTLRRLRGKLGISRRVVSAEGKADRSAEIQRVIESEINTGDIEGFGRSLLHKHLRRHGYLFPR